MRDESYMKFSRVIGPGKITYYNDGDDVATCPAPPERPPLNLEAIAIKAMELRGLADRVTDQCQNICTLMVGEKDMPTCGKSIGGNGGLYEVIEESVDIVRQRLESISEWLGRL